MNPLIIPQTDNTPGVWFEPATETLEITGCSIPENASEFYQPVLEWLATNLVNITQPVPFRVKLSYFNSTSLKALYMILKQIKDANIMGSNVTIEWHIEEDDELLLETESMLREMLGIPMTVVPIQDRGQAKAG